MNTLPSISTQFTPYSPSQLVFACAWCPESTYQSLLPDQAYTHGICSSHKKALLANIKARLARMKFRKKGGTLVKLPDGVPRFSEHEKK